MKVQFIHQRSIQAVNAQGPFTRVFAIGDIVDLPEIHAQMFIGNNGAVLATDKPQKVAEPVKDEAPKVAKPATKKAR